MQNKKGHSQLVLFIIVVIVLVILGKFLNWW